MNKNYDLELNILSCLLQRPELMENHKLKDEYFEGYKNIWVFMRVFYEKYKTFDLVLMVSLAKNKLKLTYFLENVVNAEPSPSLFGYYQDRLIETYNENIKDRQKIEEIFELANKLYTRKINLENFKNSIDNVLKK